MYQSVLLFLLAAFFLFPCTGTAEEIEVPLLRYEQWRAPNSEALTFAYHLSCGWNLGNALDCYDDTGRYSDDMDIESSWSGFYTTQELIHTIRETGYKSIRIPVSWHNHMDGFQIREAWMDRVQQVVDWAMDEGFYVILNVHHDIDEKYIYPTHAKLESSTEFLTRVWQQIADRFMDYDQHLIFEGMNEPRLRYHDNEWLFEPWVPDCSEAADCINRLNQSFVDTIRGTGGKNHDRYLIISPYANSPYTASYTSFTLPLDTVSNRLIVSVHSYLPVDFAMTPSGTDYFGIGEQDQESNQVIDSALDAIYDRFILNGIPVIVEEFGSTDKDNLQDRTNYAAYVAARARQRNMPCIIWDNDQIDTAEENYALLNRGTMEFYFPTIVEAQLKNGL